MIRLRNQFCSFSSDRSISAHPLLWLAEMLNMKYPWDLLQIVILMPAVCSICFHTFKHKYGLHSEEDGIEGKVGNYKTIKYKFRSCFKLSDFWLFDHFRKNLMEAYQRYQLSKSPTLVNHVKNVKVWIHFLKPNQI